MSLMTAITQPCFYQKNINPNTKPYRSISVGQFSFYGGISDEQGKNKHNGAGRSFNLRVLQLHYR